MHNGQPGHVVLLRVEKSEQVHSVVGNGTWTRLDASNRELNAAEIADLAYQRGVKSAETEPVAVALELLDTPVWRSFVASRGLRAGHQAEQLLRIGLADKVKQAMARKMCCHGVRQCCCLLKSLAACWPAWAPVLTCA